MILLLTPPCPLACTGTCLAQPARTRIHIHPNCLAMIMMGIMMRSRQQIHPRTYRKVSKNYSQTVFYSGILGSRKNGSRLGALRPSPAGLASASAPGRQDASISSLPLAPPGTPVDTVGAHDLGTCTDPCCALHSRTRGARSRIASDKGTGSLKSVPSYQIRSRRRGTRRASGEAVLALTAYVVAPPPSPSSSPAPPPPPPPPPDADADLTPSSASRISFSSSNWRTNR